MTRKKLRKALFIGITMLFTGCSLGRQEGELNPANETQPTVEDLFWEEPDATKQEEPDFQGDLGKNDESQPITEEENLFCGFGPLTKYKVEGCPGMLYEGGEAAMDFFLETKGKQLSEMGIGFLLFVDGIAQPYRLDTESEYQYLITHYPEKSPENIGITFHFYPVSGKAGDIIEASVLSVVFPKEKPNGINAKGYLYGPLSPSYFMMKYEADPPAYEGVVGEKGRVDNITVATRDLTKEDIQYFTKSYSMDETIMDSIVEMRLYLDGEDWSNMNGRPAMYPIDGKDSLHLRLEVAGAYKAQFGIEFLLDFEPAFHEEPIWIELQKGQVTVVEADLDLSGMEESARLNAVVSLRNCLMMANRRPAWARSSDSLLLYRKSDEFEK